MRQRGQDAENAGAPAGRPNSLNARTGAGDQVGARDHPNPAHYQTSCSGKGGSLRPELVSQPAAHLAR